MTRSAATGRLIGLAVAPAIALGLAAASTARAPGLMLINESPSLPRGLYLRDLGGGIQRGSIVAIPQPLRVRPYLSRLGMPAEVKLIKRVAAIGGDPVCALAGRVEVNGRVEPVRAADRQGVRLPEWRECRRLSANEVFLLGDTPNSFDSRYFGPAPRASIQGVYRRSLTW